MTSFVQETIVILDLEHKQQEISAIVGKNTGLAYHRATLGYVLTHVESGTRITDPNVVETPGQAQRWLEECAKILDWNLPASEIRKLTSRAELRIEVTRAWNVAMGRMEGKVSV